MRNSDRMIGTRGHNLINVGAERQRLMTAVARPIKFYGDERCILDLDPTSLGRRLKQKATIVAALQHAGEQAHKFLPLNCTAAK
jgi:hypothetical protein